MHSSALSSAVGGGTEPFQSHGGVCLHARSRESAIDSRPRRRGAVYGGGPTKPSPTAASRPGVRKRPPSTDMAVSRSVFSARPDGRRRSVTASPARRRIPRRAALGGKRSRTPWSRHAGGCRQDFETALSAEGACHFLSVRKEEDDPLAKTSRKTAKRREPREQIRPGRSRQV